MRRVCKHCGKEYNDFTSLTICPHESFEPSEDAKRVLTEINIDWKTGEKINEG